MSIAVQVHDKDLAALAELLERTMHNGILIDREPEVAHLSMLLEIESREIERRRAAWRWLNSISSSPIDKDNDWSDV